jgi:hypothetical protein
MASMRRLGAVIRHRRDPPALATSLQQAGAATRAASPGCRATMTINPVRPPDSAVRGMPPPVPGVWAADLLAARHGVLLPGRGAWPHRQRDPRRRPAGPLAVRNQAPELGRDRVRTPMPWQPGPRHGFTSAPRPWLPDPGRDDADTVAAQRRLRCCSAIQRLA